MGKNSGKFSDEMPAHRVIISPLYMDETPVTYEDFEKYVSEGGSEARYWKYDSYHKPENPVSGVSWYHAVDYCNWRSEKEGLTPAYKATGKLDAWKYPAWNADTAADGYRLPTEAEFEYAARGGLEGKQFPWGDEFDASQANYDSERGVMTGPWWRLAGVKETKPNAYGLYGMSGNVWQWTNDWYETNYYEKASRSDPPGPIDGRTKVARGGSWGSIDPEYLRVSKRSFMAPSNYNYDVGFRCVRPARSEPSVDAPSNPLHAFYRYETAHYENPLTLNVYGKEFTERLGKFIEDKV